MMPDTQAPPPPNRTTGSAPLVAPARPTPSSPWFDPFLPVAGFAALAGMAWLYATGSSFYGRILAAWMFIPWKYPFIDLAAIPLWVRCWHQHGYAVYTDASWAACGVGPIIYSPLWLRFSFLPTDPSWTNILGLSLVSAFLLSLGLLPRSRHPADRIIMLLAMFSGPMVFAVERANIDLIIFLLAVGAGLCLAGTLIWRVLAYGLMVLGGLLKFYPLVLLLLALRERLVVLLAVGLAVTAVVAGTAVVFLDELRRLTPVPSGQPFQFMWGARNLPTGFPAMLRAFLRAAGVKTPWVETMAASHWVPPVLFLLLLAITLMTAMRLARRADLRRSLAEVPDRAYRFLLVGGVLVAGCFFAGQNVNYRSVFLLLILPGILALARNAPNRPLRRLFTLTTASILCVVWDLGIRHLVAGLIGASYVLTTDALPIYLIWAVQEAAWWWLITVLVTILIRFVDDSPAWHDLQRMVRSPAPDRCRPSPDEYGNH